MRNFLDEGRDRYAVIGGLAMAAYGLSRTTLDLNLVAEAGSQDRVVAGMETLGYETVHRSRGYSNHVHPDPHMGRVDFVYVEGDTAERLFSDVRRMAGPPGSTIPVLSPEHLAAKAVDWDVPTTAEDVAALRRAREEQRKTWGPGLSEELLRALSPPDWLPRPPRRTFEGCEPFEL